MSSTILPSKLTPENRATVPAAVRAAIGAKAGDRILFIVEDEQVRLVSAASMVHALWANNHGGDGGDSVTEVREMRRRDQQAADHYAAVDLTEDTRSDEEVTADLLAAVGLAE